MPHIMYEGGLPHAKYTQSVDFDRLYNKVGWVNFVWFYGRNMLGIIELYKVYSEKFIGHVLDVYTPSNRLLVQRLGNRNDGLVQWFKNWLEKNP